jgi:hypothetical protein
MGLVNIEVEIFFLSCTENHEITGMKSLLHQEEFPRDNRYETAWILGNQSSEAVRVGVDG